MKSKVYPNSPRQTTAAAVGLVLVASPLLWAQEEPDGPDLTPYSASPENPAIDPNAVGAESPTSFRPAAPEGAVSCDALIGRDVFDRDGKKLGAIGDLVVERSSGRISYALVSSGGVLGVGSTLRAVPYEALERRLDGKAPVFGLAMDEKQFLKAPEFENSATAMAALHPDKGGKALQAYFDKATDDTEREPMPKTVAALNKGTVTPEDADDFARVSDLEDRTVVGADGKVGAVDDIVVNARQDTVMIVVDPELTYAGSEAKVAIPLNRIAAIPPGEVLSAQVTRDDIRRAKPANQDGDPFSGDRPVYRWEVQRDDRRSNTLGENSATETATEARAPGLAATTADGIRVQLIDGTWVISGDVPSERVKRRLEQSATENAGGRPVISQLVVKS